MDSPRGPQNLATSAVVIFYAVLAGIVAALGHFVLGVNPLQPLREAAPLADDMVATLGIGVGLGLLTVLLSRIFDRAFAWSRQLTRTLREAIGPLRRRDAWWLAVASSVGEEIMFRGVLLPWLGLIASSVIFGLLHGVGPGKAGAMLEMLKRFAPLVVMATVMGFAFGLTVEYTGNILAAVIAHFTINFLNLSEMYRDQWAEDATSGGNG